MEACVVEEVGLDVLYHVPLGIFRWSPEGKGARREGVGGEGVVNGDCDPIWFASSDVFGDLSLKWEVPPTVVSHVYAIHPL